MCHASRRGCTPQLAVEGRHGTLHVQSNWALAEPAVYAVRTANGARRVVNPLDPKYRLQIALWKKLRCRSPTGSARIARGLAKDIFLAIGSRYRPIGDKIRS